MVGIWYYVYVIELSDDAGPRQNAALPNVYVGYSGNWPERRFEIHKSGGPTSATIVRLYGQRLRPDLYSHLKSQRGRRNGERLEEELANALLEQGYTVHWGRGTPYSRFYR